MLRRFFASVLDVLEVAVVAVAAVFLIRNFLIQPFLVSGESMVPNFTDGDYLLIDEITYRFRSPERGEVAVFHYPNNESTYFIKRIIGLPGEKIGIKDGSVKITNQDNPEGFLLDEDYLPTNVKTAGDIQLTLAENQYFVLGDNRLYSFDSRSWGFLSSKEIVGLVRLRLWPITKVQAFTAPAY
ncbi:MAG: signal peptidase I [Candidatus Liptonbacteria bacterium]|nr:signal peptidase I [Candidatus Liptonbacteria bacterium]